MRPCACSTALITAGFGSANSARDRALSGPPRAGPRPASPAAHRAASAAKLAVATWAEARMPPWAPSASSGEMNGSSPPRMASPGGGLASSAIVSALIPPGAYFSPATPGTAASRVSASADRYWPVRYGTSYTTSGTGLPAASAAKWASTPASPGRMNGGTTLSAAVTSGRPPSAASSARVWAPTSSCVPRSRLTRAATSVTERCSAAVRVAGLGRGPERHHPAGAGVQHLVRQGFQCAEGHGPGLVEGRDQRDVQAGESHAASLPEPTVKNQFAFLT